MDQNVDRILKEIVYVPLSGRIRSKRSSCMQPFFFFFCKKMSTRHAYQWSRQNEDFNHDLEFWTCFPEVLWIGILDVLRRGPMDLNFGRASQRSDGFEFGRASQRSNGLNFGHASQRSNGFEFGHASQRSNGFEIWTYFPEVQWI